MQMERDVIGRHKTLSANVSRESSAIGRYKEVSQGNKLIQKRVWVNDTKRVGGGYWKMVAAKSTIPDKQKSFAQIEKAVGSDSIQQAKKLAKESDISRIEFKIKELELRKSKLEKRE